MKLLPSLISTAWSQGLRFSIIIIRYSFVRMTHNRDRTTDHYTESVHAFLRYSKARLRAVYDDFITIMHSSWSANIQLTYERSSFFSEKVTYSLIQTHVALVVWAITPPSHAAYIPAEKRIQPGTYQIEKFTIPDIKTKWSLDCILKLFDCYAQTLNFFEDTEFILTTPSPTQNTPYTI